MVVSTDLSVVEVDLTAAYCSSDTTALMTTWRVDNSGMLKPARNV